MYHRDFEGKNFLAVDIIINNKEIKILWNLFNTLMLVYKILYFLLFFSVMCVKRVV